MSSNKPWIPSAGDIIGGRYQIKAEFGEGGIVKVWEAVDQNDGKTVAVKHIRYNSDNYSRADQRVENLFQREVEVLRTIKGAGGHPNIIDLYDTVSEKGTPFAIVEPVEGKELEDNNTPFSPKEARRIVIGLADAMAFLHTNEIIYRDLKPDNAMLKTDGTPVLIDFNTAKEVDSNISASLVCPACETPVSASDYICPSCDEAFDKAKDTRIEGNNRFKAPESTNQKAQFRQGPWSDVYSLGKTLHDLIIDGDVPPVDNRGPQDFVDSCPDYMNEIIKRATKTDTGKRYNNAKVFKLVLENRDPDPPVTAKLIHVQENREYEIQPGDTIGRQDADGPEATVTVQDPEKNSYISAVQVEFDSDQTGNWALKDRSLNGTYVQRGNGWERILCENGRSRLQQKGLDPTDRHGNIPPEKGQLNDGALIKLVDPTYDVLFEFKKVI